VERLTGDGERNRQKGQDQMLSRVVLSLASVVASVGLLLYGMGTSYATHDDDMKSLGLILGIGGFIFTIIGIFWYRVTEAAEVELARAKYGDDGS
jgi:hypothetical protein